MVVRLLAAKRHSTEPEIRPYAGPLSSPTASSTEGLFNLRMRKAQNIAYNLRAFVEIGLAMNPNASMFITKAKKVSVEKNRRLISGKTPSHLTVRTNSVTISGAYLAETVLC